MKDQCEHCWHPTGNILTSYPAKTEEICCYCGSKRHLQQKITIENPAKHGTHHPQAEKEK